MRGGEMKRRGFFGAILATTAATAVGARSERQAQKVAPVKKVAPAAERGAYERQVGTLDVETKKGVLIASLPVFGVIMNGAVLRVDKRETLIEGRADRAIARLPGFGEFDVDFRSRGELLDAGTWVTVDGGLHIYLDLTGRSCSIPVVFSV